MSLKKILKFAAKRAKEPTTYVGLAAIATAVGAPQVGEMIGQVGTAIVLVAGGGLVAMSQEPERPPEPRQPARPLGIDPTKPGKKPPSRR